jgi:hypothetical protein
MLLIAPGDAVASPRSRRSGQRSADADFIATACTGQLANAAQPLPAPNFEDSRAGVWLFRLITVAGVATAACQFGWLR